MDKVVITLEIPVTFNGEEFSKLAFREPDVGCMVDAESCGGGEQTYLFGLLASMCGMPFEAFRLIKYRDVKRIIASTDHMVKNFDQDGAATGETSPS